MIHYHGGPITPLSVADAVWRGRHGFVSFENPEQIGMAASICQSFALDNGAFSAWSTGKQLDVKGYAQWVKEWMRHPGFDWCLIPDVIDGSENDNIGMIAEWRESGVPFSVSVPVWHLHESLERLAYMAVAWPRIAIGSSGQWGTVGNEAWWSRMDEAMRVICDEHGRPKCKLHGLRMLSTDVFPKLPLASADSTNVARNHARESRRYQMTNGMGAIVIAGRVESQQSASLWRGMGASQLLFEEPEEEA
jgi:hypothetical protein